MNEQIYCLEAYAPPYPETNRYVRIHEGSIHSIKDSLSPNMIECVDLFHRTKKEATQEAKLWIKELNVIQIATGKPLYKFKK